MGSDRIQFQSAARPLSVLLVMSLAIWSFHNNSWRGWRFRCCAHLVDGGTHAGLVAGQAVCRAIGMPAPSVIAVGVAKGVVIESQDVATRK